ncbi:MAG: CsbD family protein [Rhodanobacteraceae bacterium]
MDDDRVEGQRSQLYVKPMTRWSKLTEGDMGVANGNADYPAAKLRERHGVADTGANHQILEFDLDVLEDDELGE